MELSKVQDGFIEADTLIIKARVQVIRVRTDRPFRCLDTPYRREILMRVYMMKVVQIFQSFVEEHSAKLGKLVDDKARWSSFCAFWLGMGKKSQQHMSQETTGSILKAVVKHFFLEKEVTSTIVMDSLYSGLKALKGQNTISGDCELPRPIVGVKNDAFVLVDDVLRLLERAASEPLPPNHAMVFTAGEEFNEDRIEREKWRVLTELGCRTIEIFVLDHIFSKIEFAHKESISLKKQEELICEEEAAGGGDKENKFKKKKRKQKKKNRKGKEEKTSCTIQDKIIELDTSAERKEPEIVHEKTHAVEDASDSGICRSIMRTMCTLEKRGDFFFLTLKGDSNKDQEHRLNPLLIASIRAALAEARSQATARSALITQAEGGFFSNGFDMRHAKAVGEAAGNAYAARAQLVRMVDLFRGVVADLFSLPMPTIAAVTGHAAEAGLVLALSHDYVVMTSSRGVMYFSELDVGMSLPVPDYFSALVNRKVGSSAARREIALSAAKIGAEAAVRMGIVDEAYHSSEEVVAAAVQKAEELGKRRWSGQAYAGIRKDLYPEVCELLRLKDEIVKL